MSDNFKVSKQKETFLLILRNVEKDDTDIIRIYLKCLKEVQRDEEIINGCLDNLLTQKNIMNFYELLPKELKNDNIVEKCFYRIMSQYKKEVSKNTTPEDISFLYNSLLEDFKKNYVVTLECIKESLKDEAQFSEMVSSLSREMIVDLYDRFSIMGKSDEMLKYMNDDLKKDTEFIAGLIGEHNDDISEILSALPEETSKKVKEMPQIREIIEKEKTIDEGLET